MVVSHRVKWERTPDFLEWTDRVTALMSGHKGFLGLVSIPPQVQYQLYRSLGVVLGYPPASSVVGSLAHLMNVCHAVPHRYICSFAANHIVFCLVYFSAYRKVIVSVFDIMYLVANVHSL